MTDHLTLAQSDLVAAHQELATHASIWAHRKWPRADPGELLSAAFEGLIDAAVRWRPEDGVTFQGYARKRIRGEIVDDWRRRNGRRGGKLLYPFPVDDDGEVIESVLAVEDPGFERVNDAVAAASIVRDLAPKLRDADRFMVTELGRGSTLTEVGARLGVSESRVCQVRAGVASGARHHVAGVCDACSKRFTVAMPHQRFCSQTCRYAAAGSRQREEHPSRLVSCACCGNEFRALRSDRIYCSTACRMAAAYDRRRVSA